MRSAASLRSFHLTFARLPCCAFFMKTSRNPLPNFEDPKWNARQDKLEKDLIKACLKLIEHTGSDAFKIRIPDSDPKLFILCGDDQRICDLIDSPQDADTIEPFTHIYCDNCAKIELAKRTPAGILCGVCDSVRLSLRLVNCRVLICFSACRSAR